MALGRGLAIIAAAVLALTVVGCGGDDGPGSPGLPGELSYEQWSVQVSRLCDDGTQEAIALPLPATNRQIALDAAALADVVANVRDGILGLGAPEGREEQVEVYIAELGDDVGVFERIEAAASEGGELSELRGLIDESAGRAALELGLEDCAAFANAVARTP